MSDKNKRYRNSKIGGVVKTDEGTTSDAKDGGYFDGRPHSDGGIKAINVDTNQPIEVEGGEVIITKDAVSDPTKKEFMGKKMTNREILSEINESGGGVSFEYGGELTDDIFMEGGLVDFIESSRDDIPVNLQFTSQYYARFIEDALPFYEGSRLKVYLTQFENSKDIREKVLDYQGNFRIRDQIFFYDDDYDIWVSGEVENARKKKDLDVKYQLFQQEGHFSFDKTISKSNTIRLFHGRLGELPFIVEWGNPHTQWKLFDNFYYWNNKGNIPYGLDLENCENYRIRIISKSRGSDKIDVDVFDSFDSLDDYINQFYSDYIEDKKFGVHYIVSIRCNEGDIEHNFQFEWVAQTFYLDDKVFNSILWNSLKDIPILFFRTYGIAPTVLNFSHLVKNNIDDVEVVSLVEVIDLDNNQRQKVYEQTNKDKKSSLQAHYDLRSYTEKDYYNYDCVITWSDDSYVRFKMPSRDDLLNYFGRSWLGRETIDVAISIMCGYWDLSEPRLMKDNNPNIGESEYPNSWIRSGKFDKPIYHYSFGWLIYPLENPTESLIESSSDMLSQISSNESVIIQSPKEIVMNNLMGIGQSELDSLDTLRFILRNTPDYDFESKMLLKQEVNRVYSKTSLVSDISVAELMIKDNDPIEELINADSKEIKRRPNIQLTDPNSFQPDGEPSTLSTFNNRLVDSKMFKNWFGDWRSSYNLQKGFGDDSISSSKVVTKGGEPLVVYMGVGREFEAIRFDRFPIGYFAVNYDYAVWFAENKDRVNGGWVLPFFLNIREPLDLTIFGIDKVKPKDFYDWLFLQTGMTSEQLGFVGSWQMDNMPSMEVWMYIRNNRNFLNILKESQIVDGLHFYENNPSVPTNSNQYQTEVWATFYPNQSKLADSDRGKAIFSNIDSFRMEKGGKIR